MVIVLMLLFLSSVGTVRIAILARNSEFWPTFSNVWKALHSMCTSIECMWGCFLDLIDIFFLSYDYFFSKNMKKIFFFFFFFLYFFFWSAHTRDVRGASPASQKHPCSIPKPWDRTP